MNRFEDEIKAAFEAPKPKRKEEFINLIKPSKVSVGRFLLSQMGYIRKSTWTVFALILICIILAPFVLDEVPRQAHDIPVDAICTQEDLMWIKK